MRERSQYAKLQIDECRMAFRLEVFQFESRGNMPSRYKRDLRCRACVIGEQGEGGQEQEQNENKQKEQEEQKEDQWNTEDQKHLEIFSGYSELWDGLGPLKEQFRIKYFMRVKLKRLKRLQRREESSSSSRPDRSR